MQAASHLVTHQHSSLWLMSVKKRSSTLRSAPPASRQRVSTSCSAFKVAVFKLPPHPHPRMCMYSSAHWCTATEERITVTVNETRGLKLRLSGFDHFSVMVWRHVAKRHFITSGELGLSLYLCQVGGVQTFYLKVQIFFFLPLYAFIFIKSSRIEEASA